MDTYTAYAWIFLHVIVYVCVRENEDGGGSERDPGCVSGVRKARTIQGDLWLCVRMDLSHSSSHQTRLSKSSRHIYSCHYKGVKSDRKRVLFLFCFDV